MACYLGIDTGGTFTDAVICDSTSRAILATAKSLTTRFDLSVGIGDALSRLPVSLLQQVQLVALVLALHSMKILLDRLRSKYLYFLLHQERNHLTIIQVFCTIFPQFRLFQ